MLLEKPTDAIQDGLISGRDGGAFMAEGRFASFIMQENYLLACTRYIELKPVRAKLVTQPEDWPWSSTQAHISDKNSIFANTKPLLDIVNNPWKKFLSCDVGHSKIKTFRKHERTGRPLGGGSFIKNLEHTLNRKLKLQKPGPKRKDK